MDHFASLSRRGQLLRLRQLALTALQQYGVDEPRMSALKHEHNTTFRVWDAAGHPYVLRIHRPGQHSLPAIRSELIWLAALRQETDLCVSQPVFTNDGSPCASVKVEGVPESRVCVLFRWQPGRFVNDRLTTDHLQRVGMFMACLHEHAARWQPPVGFVRGRVDNLTAETRRESLVDPHMLDRRALSQHPGEQDAEQAVRLVTDLLSPDGGALVAQAIAAIRRVHAEIGYDPDVFGLIHADLHQDNYLFGGDRQDRQMCAIDFDDCGYGHYLFDLNVTLLEVQHLRTYATLRTALLEGYRRIRPLPSNHEAYLATFFILRRLQLLMWVLQSREHPAFRAWWREAAEDDLGRLQQMLEAGAPLQASR